MSASEYTLQCNFHKCRVKLCGFAWVTACSHIFCDQHGSVEFSRTPAICPACSSVLSGKLDVLRTELVPSEQYKSMVLVGLPPETILDISHKAMTFWTYQVGLLGCNGLFTTNVLFVVGIFITVLLWFFFISGKPREIIYGVQSVQSWGTSGSNGDVFDPAEPK